MKYTGALEATQGNNPELFEKTRIASLEYIFQQEDRVPCESAAVAKRRRHNRRIMAKWMGGVYLAANKSTVFMYYAGPATDGESRIVRIKVAEDDLRILREKLEALKLKTMLQEVENPRPLGRISRLPRAFTWF